MERRKLWWCDGLKKFNFLNAFIPRVAYSIASMHCWLSVQTCCCSFLAWGEQRYELHSSATVLSEQRGLCNACYVETHREVASEVPRWKTELIFQVRGWGCCPNRFRVGFEQCCGITLIPESLGHLWAGQWGLTGQGAQGMWELGLRLIPPSWD